MRCKWSPNESETFSVAMNADGHCLSTAARFVRKEMCEAWSAIDTGRHELETRMAEVGILEPLPPKAGVLRLNIGGARVHVGHSILRGEGEEESCRSRLSDLLESVWDDRIPRDSEGYIVIDESPSCAKFLIHQLLKRTGTSMGMDGLSFDDILPSDEKSHMPHVCSVLGLTENTNVDDSASAVPLDEEVNTWKPKALKRRRAFRPVLARRLIDADRCDYTKSTPSAEVISTEGLFNNAGKIGMEVVGGSCVLDPVKCRLNYEMVKELCPGKPAKMELLYRASRDGWTGQDFHSRCGDDSPSTITLFHFDYGDVLGGFSSVSWCCKDANGTHKASPGAFMFMMREDGEHIVERSKKCIPQEGFEDKAVYLHPNRGPSFGCMEVSPFLRLYPDGSSDGSSDGDHWFDNVDTAIYDIAVLNPIFFGLGQSPDGIEVDDIEVFRVCTTREAAEPPPRKNLERKSTFWGASPLDLSAPDPAAMSAESYNDDIRSFGVSIADCLMEERVALHQARVELEEARAKTAASADALSALYGEDVAANEEGVAAVADLNVRGTRMTTLRSTLQLCPDSAFAARFDEDKWPPSEKDMNKHGRRVIDDCSPSVFSKVLDVLRMRKREAWAPGGAENGRSDLRVMVKAADRESFEAFVHMYFTGQESFIMDLVQEPNEASKNDNSACGGQRASEYLADVDGARSRRRAVGLQGSNARARRSSKW